MCLDADGRLTKMGQISRCPAINVTLCAVLCYGAGRAALDLYFPPAGPIAANPPHAAAAAQDGTNRQADISTYGRTSCRYIDPACRTYASSVSNVQFTPHARHDKTVLSVSCHAGDVNRVSRLSGKSEQR